ncbi:unnamed protein product [Echinostoma caproni]|uniref:BRCT domain-containing protein n=1 Tax=Echinostoma caproni TaxID=27848 RepID=A0A183B7F9_9TREM|nr:unnamed protein product [Echinostoma caproni]
MTNQADRHRCKSTNSTLCPGSMDVLKGVPSICKFLFILAGVVALVEVKSSLGNPALAISSRLQYLGATVARTLGPSVTHVVFRNGSESLLAAAKKAKKHIVTPAWVKACQTYNFRVVESSFAVTEKQDITMLEVSHDATAGTAESAPLDRLLDPSSVPRMLVILT